MPRPNRLVITWHGDIVRQKRLKPYAEWIQHRLAGRADAILCTSERMVAGSPFLRRHVDRVRFLPFMIDMTPFDALRGDAARIAATRASRGGRYVLGCGRLIHYKGFDILVDALAGTDIRAVVVGEGPLLAELEARARELGGAGQVAFVGGIDDDALRDLYAACEFFVFPSTTAGEAFGMAQLEAMAAGRPVVNTWLPTSVPDVSRDGETGLTVPPSDVEALRAAMVRLWNDAELRSRLAAAAEARVRNVYERGRVLDRLLAFYADTMVERRVP